ncbi:MAG: flagellar motor protein MotB [Bryobacteraceae bacterium]|jgi:chemotaxis protein MotB
MDAPTEPEEVERHMGGAWKVAYADFVTALMALFIVLWLVSSSREVRDSVAGYFRDPRGFHRLTGTAHAGSGEALSLDEANIRKLREKVEEAMRRMPEMHGLSRYVQFTVTGEGLRIELMENEGGMFFETGSPRPTPNGERMFRLLAGQLEAMPNQVAIEGHTDSRPFRDARADAYGNWELSFDRANMARRIMIAGGLRPDQVAEIRGYADRSALIAGAPADSRNRRVSVVMKYLGQ